MIFNYTGCPNNTGAPQNWFHNFVQGGLNGFQTHHYSVLSKTLKMFEVSSNYLYLMCFLMFWTIANIEKIQYFSDYTPYK